MACGEFGKFLFMGLTFILLGLGSGITAVGIMMKVDSSLADKEIKQLLNNVTFQGCKLGDLMDHLSTFVVCVGGFICIIAVIGLIGVCCKNRIVLITYALIVLILLIMEIAVIALFAVARNKVGEVVKQKLLDLIKEYEDDNLEGVDDLTKGWNILFMKMQCCGINAFEKTNDFENSTWWSSGKHGQIPVFCCKNVTRTNYIIRKYRYYLAYTSDYWIECPKKATSDNAYTNLGCYDAVVKEVAKYSDQVIGIGSAILVIQILSVISAYYVCRDIDD